MTLTRDVAGGRLPSYCDGLLHVMGPHLPGLTVAAKKGGKYGSASRCS